MLWRSKSVSYTHLDVYKRQSQDIRRRMRSLRIKKNISWLITKSDMLLWQLSRAILHR